MKKTTLTLIALAFAATGISAAMSPAETECRKKASDALKATQESQKKVQVECKAKKNQMEKAQCNAGIVKAMKEATAKRDADFKACKAAATPAKPKK